MVDVFANMDIKTIRDELKLNRADVGWFQVRKVLQVRNAIGNFAPVNFKVLIMRTKY
ncbi:MAG: hypothetical protein Q8880_07500 [Bacteroidota bacterium]|nr:hypothetical protein [Bacteroidota bacterium]